MTEKKKRTGLNMAIAVNVGSDGHTTTVTSDGETTVVTRDGVTEVIRHDEEDGQ